MLTCHDLALTTPSKFLNFIIDIMISQLSVAKARGFIDRKKSF